MKILALETSTEYCSAALWLDGASLARDAHAGRAHSELLLPMLDALLAQAGLRLPMLDAIAFGKGPGSFTGLRIACGVAQGLALGADLPVVGVDTLAALAHASGAAQVVCSLDARMREIYHAAYRRDAGELIEVQAPGLYAARSPPPLPAGEWHGCGNAFAVYGDALREALGARLSGVDAGAWPHARDIAALAAVRFSRAGGDPPEQALPVYIRDKVALTVEEQR